MQGASHLQREMWLSETAVSVINPRLIKSQQPVQDQSIVNTRSCVKHPPFFIPSAIDLYLLSIMYYYIWAGCPVFVLFAWTTTTGTPVWWLWERAQGKEYSSTTRGLHNTMVRLSSSPSLQPDNLNRIPPPPRDIILWNATGRACFGSEWTVLCRQET